VEIVPTYNRSDWIWATLQEFLRTLLLELVIVSLVTILFLKNVRSAVGPIAILLLSVLFTVLPMTAFDQTINLFSLAGLCIAIGAIDDATIVIVENCTAELAKHKSLSPAENRAVVVDSIAAVAPPLLFTVDHSRFVCAGLLSRAAGSASVRSSCLYKNVRDGFFNRADAALSADCHRVDLCS
jgi:Cu(I)/Ag(I) efflux system membrane protein CusA/SilA